MSELTDSPKATLVQSGLQSNALTWKHVTVLSLAGCGPAASIALNLQFMGQFAGLSLVLAFLLVWPAILLLMNTLAQFSRHIHTAGGLYSYNLRTWGAKFGFVYGWVFLGAYMVLSAAGFAVFGGWLSEWLAGQFQIMVPWWLITLIAVAFVTALSVRGTTESMRTSLILVGLSVLVILTLALWILFSGGDSGSGGLSIEPLLPSGAGAAGWSGIGLAMSYAVLSHAGIEEGTTLAEEVREPKRNVPKGLWLVALILPAFYILVSYAMVHGYGIANIGAFGEDPAPLQTIALHYWGEVGLGIVVIAAIISILGFSQAGFLAGTRVLYALGRDHVLPQWLGRTSARQTPANASITMGAVTILLGVPLALVTGPFQVWGYFGFLIGIAFLVSYIVTNVALIVYTKRAGVFSWLKHGLPAGAAGIIFAYPLYRTVWPLPPGEYAVLPLVYIGWVIIGIALLVYTQRSRPEVLTRMMSEESKF